MFAGVDAPVYDTSLCLQELMTAAMGLNTSLIEDPKMKRRPPSCARQFADMSDQMALCSPSFTVIQSLVSLLANNATVKSPTNKSQCYIYHHLTYFQHCYIYTIK